MAVPREVSGNPKQPDKRVSASLTLVGVVICATALFAVTPRAPIGPATPAAGVGQSK